MFTIHDLLPDEIFCFASNPDAVYTVSENKDGSWTFQPFDPSHPVIQDAPEIIELSDDQRKIMARPDLSFFSKNKSAERARVMIREDAELMASIKEARNRGTNG